MLAAFQSEPVINRRQRRLFHRNHDVPVCLDAGQLKIRHIHSPKDSQPGNPAPGFIFVLLRERLSALQLHLSRNDLRLRPGVADDQHMIDDHLRPFVNQKMQIDIGARRSNARIRLHRHVLIAEIEIQQRELV